MATRRGSVNACCWPSKESLIKDSRLTKPTVNKAIKSLEDKGIIIVINHGWFIDRNGNRKHNGIDGNIYYFCYDIEYQDGLLEDDMHPMNKSCREYDNFKLALDVYNG